MMQDIIIKYSLLNVEKLGGEIFKNKHSIEFACFPLLQLVSVYTYLRSLIYGFLNKGTNLFP